MTEDIVPGLLESIKAAFREGYDSSPTVAALLEKVQQGTATYAQAQEYAIEVSRLIGLAWEKHISSAVLPDGRMYYNIASRLIPSVLDDNHALVADYAAKVQQQLNQEAGIGIRAQVASVNTDRENGLVNLASNPEMYDDVSAQLKTAMENFSQAVVNNTLKANVDFQGRAGLTPRIIRRAESGACKWCRALAGVYDYPDVPENVYRRHGNCRCVVEYDPGSGKRQNVHTKQWTTAEETLEQRKLIQGVDTRTGIQRSVLQKAGVENVTAEYLRSATPGIGEVSYDAGYVVSHHSEEIKIAQWLHENLGGDIVLLKEANRYQILTPDYLWNGVFWDLKCVTTVQSANSAVRHGLKQISENPGGIILNYAENKISLNALQGILEKRLKASARQTVDILVLQSDKLVCVYRYKK